MCELLGMSANVPTDICFSFTGLMQRGGKTGPHRDGWGIVFYEGRGCRAFHDPAPSADSELAQLIHRHPIKSKTVISHIRQATHGRVCLENTHPFIRELWGRQWSFAHNGKLPGVKRRPLRFYQPVGTTDSEHAFCWLLGEIRARWERAPRRRRSLYRMLEALSRQLAEHGTFNLLLSDSLELFAFNSTKLHWLTRRAPFTAAQLIDSDLRVNFREETTPSDVVTVIATQPLTSVESWTPVERGTLYRFSEGEVYRSLEQSPLTP